MESHTVLYILKNVSMKIHLICFCNEPDQTLSKREYQSQLSISLSSIPAIMGGSVSDWSVLNDLQKQWFQLLLPHKPCLAVFSVATKHKLRNGCNIQLITKIVSLRISELHAQFRTSLETLFPNPWPLNVPANFSHTDITVNVQSITKCSSLL